MLKMRPGVKRLYWRAALPIAVTCGLLGLFTLFISHATTPTNSVEAESGTVTGTASLSDDTSASGNKSVKFGDIRNIRDKGYGFSANPFSLTSAQQDNMLSDMSDLGMTWIRFDIAWSGVQPTRASAYNWNVYDSFIAKAQSHNIKALGIIDFSTSWAAVPSCASSSDKCEVSNPADYTTYAKAIVQHFGTKLGAVELWNEPNTTNFWQPAPNPTKYAAMATQAYAAIKSVDPGMLVLSAGLAPAATASGGNYAEPDFLAAVYTAAKGAKFADAVGAHPYSYPAPASQYFSWSGWSKMSQTPTSLRSVMATNGDSKEPIWATEVGVATNGPGNLFTCSMINSQAYTLSSYDHADDCGQSKILTDAITVGRSYSFMGPIFLYTYRDLGTSTSTSENFYGLETLDGSHKASYNAVKQAIAVN